MNNIIEDMIYEKLTENTGKHFLDSGGTSNRNWQRNQEKTLQDFINEPEQKFEVCFDKNNIANELIRNVSVFHFLAGHGSQLELDDICNQFNAYNTLEEDYADCEINGIKISAWDYLNDYDLNINGTWNTYNGESDLSQVLQGANLEINDEQYILIQIHGGADVRGGYTDALLFKCSEGIINEYLFEYMDSYELDQELEYIDIMYDYFDNSKVFQGERLEKIKNQLSE
tara:strand:+ start:777 stop:1460 length:684 start_codon:yes stop_codon:yes gene_type:complete